MPVLEKPGVSLEEDTLFIGEEKMDELRAIVSQQFEEFGMEYNPHVTPQQVWAMMLADGIRPEDNFLSRAIIAAREE